MRRIAEYHLKEALNIRKEWLNVVQTLNVNETRLNNVLEQAKKIESEYINKVKGEKDLNHGYQVVISAIDEFSKLAVIIDNEMAPLRDKKKVLTDRSDRLWEILQAEYSDMSPDDIRSQVMAYIVQHGAV